MRKPLIYTKKNHRENFCFSPLAGIRYAETLPLHVLVIADLDCFSPLAGIRYAETTPVLEVLKDSCNVSVPLRGLDMRKRLKDYLLAMIVVRFSPLAGIRYAETCHPAGLQR